MNIMKATSSQQIRTLAYKRNRRTGARELATGKGNGAWSVVMLDGN